MNIGTGAAETFSADVAGAGAYVDDLALAGRTLYVGGDFLTIGGAPRTHLAAIDTISSTATS